MGRTATVLAFACAALGCRAAQPAPAQVEPEAEQTKVAPAAAPEAPPAQAPSAGPAQVQPATPAAPAATDFDFLGKRLRLHSGPERCEVEYPAGEAGARRLTLELTPPCYVMVWRETRDTRPSADGPSDGVVVGKAGEPEAWRYPSAGGATVIAVIGDRVPADLQDSTHAERVAHGYRCGGSVQGVLFRGSEMRLGKKRDQIGEKCVEVGMDEKGFWLLAH